jgi:hypothetical protein
MALQTFGFSLLLRFEEEQGIRPQSKKKVWLMGYCNHTDEYSAQSPVSVSA